MIPWVPRLRCESGHPRAVVRFWGGRESCVLARSRSETVICQTPFATWRLSPRPAPEKSERVARTSAREVRGSDLAIAFNLSYSSAVSRVRRLFLADRYFFITVRRLQARAQLAEAGFHWLALAFHRARLMHPFDLTAWVFLPDRGQVICAPVHAPDEHPLRHSNLSRRHHSPARKAADLKSGGPRYLLALAGIILLRKVAEPSPGSFRPPGQAVGPISSRLPWRTCGVSPPPSLRGCRNAPSESR